VDRQERVMKTFSSQLFRRLKMHHYSDPSLTLESLRPLTVSISQKVIHLTMQIKERFNRNLTILKLNGYELNATPQE
jgi:hypothetical protein